MVFFFIFIACLWRSQKTTWKRWMGSQNYWHWKSCHCFQKSSRGEIDFWFLKEKAYIFNPILDKLKFIWFWKNFVASCLFTKKSWKILASTNFDFLKMYSEMTPFKVIAISIRNFCHEKVFYSMIQNRKKPA